MPYIHLGHGCRTLVDDDIYAIVAHLPWYAARNGRSKHVYAPSTPLHPLTGTRLRPHNVVARLARGAGTGPIVYCSPIARDTAGEVSSGQLRRGVMATVARRSNGRRLSAAAFKRHQIERIQRGESSAAELSRELGVARSLIVEAPGDP